LTDISSSQPANGDTVRSGSSNTAKSVLFSVFLFAVGFGMMMPALPALILAIEDVSLSEATLLGGYVAASYAFFQFLLRPLMGNLSDLFGRRPIFLACIAGFALDLLIMGIAPSIFWLFIGRSLAGGFGMIFGPANAIMADITPAESRTKSFGLTGAAFGVGLIFGPALGGLLGDLGVRIPFLVGAAIMVVNLLIAWWRIPETLDPQSRRPFEIKRANPLGSITSLSSTPGLLSLCLVLIFWQMSFAIYQTTWLFFSSIKYGWDSGTIGLSLAIIGISVVIVQGLLMGRLVQRLGEKRTTCIAILVAIFTSAGFMVIDISAIALILCAFVGLQAMAVPSVIGMMSRRLSEETQGELQGFFSSATALAALLAPLMYNSSLSYFTGTSAPVQFAGIPFLLSTVLAALTIAILIFGKSRSTSGIVR